MILIDVWYRYRKPIVLSSMQKHQRRISSFISSMSHPLSKDLTVYHQTVKLYRVSLQWIRQVNYNSAMVELDLTGCVKFRGKPHLRQQCCNASIECKQVIIFSKHSARTISECEPHCFFQVRKNRVHQGHPGQDHQQVQRWGVQTTAGWQKVFEEMWSECGISEGA